MQSNISSTKPHVVCIPFLAQSHIKAMLKLAKILYHKGFYVTFVNSEFNHNRFLQSRGPNSLDDLPDFRFKTIPDGIPNSDVDATQDVNALCHCVRFKLLAPFRDLIRKLNDDALALNCPPVTCIVSDGFMPFTTIVGEEFGIPIVMFFTISACALMGFKHIAILKEKGYFPLKDESYQTNGYLDTIIDWIPGMKDIRLKDLPSIVRATELPEDLYLFPVEACDGAHKASAIVIHTFDALEQDVLNALSSLFPPIYAIGPLELLVNQISQPLLQSVGYSLWKEDTECLQWLNSKSSSSVVYVNFGSMIITTPDQLVEFGWGLANSKHSFLWIIRPDLLMGKSAILPPEFIEEVKERCLITSWCPQEEVLNHPSIRVFLTHSGWNSTIESLSSGIPMLCWPFYADQPTNCRFVCKEWGVGKEIDSNVKRDEVERLVREVMEGKDGKKIKNKAMEWKRLGEEAISPNGSSSSNLEELVNKVLLSKK